MRRPGRTAGAAAAGRRPPKPRVRRPGSARSRRERPYDRPRTAHPRHRNSFRSVAPLGGKSRALPCQHRGRVVPRTGRWYDSPPCAGCCSSSGSIVFVDTLFFAALTPLLPHYADELGLGKAGAGRARRRVPGRARFFGAIPSGIVAARFGVKPTVLVGMTSSPLTTAVFGLATEAWQLDLARFCQGARQRVLVDGRARVARRGGAARPAWRADRPGLRRRDRRRAVRAGARRHRLGRRHRLDVRRRRGRLARGRGLGGGDAGARGPGTPQPPRRAVRARCATAAILLGGLVRRPPGAALRDARRARAAAPLASSASVRSRSVRSWLDRGRARGGEQRRRRPPRRPARPARARSASGSSRRRSSRSSLPWPDHAFVLAVARRLRRLAFGTFYTPGMTLLTHAAEHRGLDYGYAFALVNLAWAPGQTVGAAVGGAVAERDLATPCPYLTLAASRAAYACRRCGDPRSSSSPTAARSPLRVFRTAAQARDRDGRGRRARRPRLAARPLGRRDRRDRRRTSTPTEHIRAARETGADAIHPGYGFLAESAELRRGGRGGRAHLGRPAAGRAARGRRQARGEADRARGRRARRRRTATPAELGFPLLVKAAAGGGGRGMRVVRSRRRARRGGRGGRVARRRRPSATTASSSSATSSVRGTSRSSSSRDAHGHGRRARRARVLDPAPPPEGARGVAVARARPRAPRTA